MATTNHYVDAAEVGARLRRLRKATGLSQRELGAPPVSYAYISRIESGTRKPSLSALIVLAERLGTTARYLLTGEHEGECPFCGERQRKRKGSNGSEASNGNG